MFEDSLLESGGRNSKLRARGPWATVVSFAFEFALVGVLLLIPFIYTEVLPVHQLNCYVVAPTAPRGSAPHADVQVATQAARPSQIDNTRLKFPGPIPHFIAMFKDAAAPISNTSGFDFAQGTGLPGDSLNGSRLVEAIVSSRPAVAASGAVETRRRLKVSGGVTSGLLIHKIQPSYPTLARLGRISGEVQLQAVIGRDGTIENLRVVGGHPMLVQSALEAVRQWRYKPYYLNGVPVEVETQITVSFTLAGA